MSRDKSVTQRVPVERYCFDDCDLASRYEAEGVDPIFASVVRPRGLRCNGR